MLRQPLLLGGAQQIRSGDQGAWRQLIDRFSGRLLQYLGRVLRPAPGKQEARVFDYVDIHVDTLVKAANARQRVYSQPGRRG